MLCPVCKAPKERLQIMRPAWFRFNGDLIDIEVDSRTACVCMVYCEDCEHIASSPEAFASEDERTAV